jgi:DNA repair exonuclease SbcCD nuclease subunit
MKKVSNFSYRFIHASDIHLGSHQYRNELRANDFINTFREILSLSLFYKVDFVILGGDIFNSREILPNHMNKIVNILKVFQNKSNSNVPIICIEGNHDIRKHIRGVKISDDHNWLKFLNNLGLICLLDADFESNSNEIYTEYDFYEKSGGKISFNDVIVYGNRYLGNNFKRYFPRLYSGIKRNNNNTFNILIQHLGVEGQIIMFQVLN